MRVDTSLAGRYTYMASVDDAWESGDLIKKGKGKGKPNKVRKRFLDLWREALDTGNFDTVPRKEGMDPVEWQLQHIGSRHRRAIQEEMDRFNEGRDEPGVPWQAYYKAARLGLVDVIGLFNGDDEVKLETARDSGLRTSCVTHESMDIIGAISRSDGTNIGEHLINEIGLRVIHGGASGKS